MDQVVGVLEALPPPVVLALAALLVMGETGVLIGLFFPVEITLLFVGFLAYLGEVPFAPAFLLMTGAAITGDALALRSGRKYGPRVRASRFGARIGAERWSRADRILHRLGGRSAFIARWVPFVRTLLPRLAGSAGMPYRRYVGWNVAGVVTAVGGSVVLGYLAGASYQRAAERFGSATSAVLLLAGAVVVIVLIGRWLGGHPYPVRTLASWAASRPPLRWHERFVRAVQSRVGGGWALAIDLAVGLALLVVLGLGLSSLVRLVVDHSGLSGVDDAVAGWFGERRTEPMAAVAEATATLLGGWVLIAAVAVVALVRAVRARAWHGDLVGLVGTVGAALPLVILVVVAGFGATVAVAGLGTLGWLLTRGARWPPAVVGWTVAAIGVVVVTAARLYLGYDSASQAATALLIGSLWIAVYMIAWANRAGRTRKREPDLAASPPK